MSVCVSVCLIRCKISWILFHCDCLHIYKWKRWVCDFSFGWRTHLFLVHCCKHSWLLDFVPVTSTFCHVDLFHFCVGLTQHQQQTLLTVCHALCLVGAWLSCRIAECQSLSFGVDDTFSCTVKKERSSRIVSPWSWRQTLLWRQDYLTPSQSQGLQEVWTASPYLSLNRVASFGHHRWLHKQFPPFFSVLRCSLGVGEVWTGLPIPWCCHEIRRKHMTLCSSHFILEETEG